MLWRICQTREWSLILQHITKHSSEFRIWLEVHGEMRHLKEIGSITRSRSGQTRESAT